MIFSTNQNRQFYVATGTAGQLTDAGDYKVTKSDDEIFVTVKGAETTLRSDIIPFDHILSVNTTDVAKMLPNIQKLTYEITVPSDYEDIVKVVVHQAYANDSNSRMTLYTTQAEIASSDFATKRADIAQFCTLECAGAGSNSVSVTPKFQSWKKGLAGGDALFDVTLEFPGAEVKDGFPTPTDVAYTADEKKLHAYRLLADLELFCYSERAQWTKFENVYAGVGAPTLLIDAVTDYSDKKIQTVQYYFVNPNGHRSVKEIQFLVSSEITDIKKN